MESEHIDKLSELSCDPGIYCNDILAALYRRPEGSIKDEYREDAGVKEPRELKE